MLPNPFDDIEYNLRQSQISVPFNFNSIAVWTDQHCGDKTISFFQANRTPMPSLMEVLKLSKDTFEIVINYSEDYSLHGAYEIVYAVWFEDYTQDDYFKIVEVPFTLTVIDECLDPYGIQSVEGSNGLVDQEYTITDHARTYQIDSFEADPIWCAITYSFSFDSSGQESQSNEEGEAYGAV